jgi:YbbR domain-containing protein
MVKMYHSQINNTIDVSELQNGMYFIAIYSEGKKIIRKFVKQ